MFYCHYNMIRLTYDAAQLKTIKKTLASHITALHALLLTLMLIPHALTTISVKSTAKIIPKNALFPPV